MTTQGEDVKKAELRKRIEHQVACEERAHRIVERLIDNPITDEMLCNSLQYITQSHYSDIVEERAVSKLCGYPVCPNDLGNVPKQKYMISTKTNKVYDLEARKNYCSGRCYKASKHLEKQISNTPVWSRKNMPPVKFDLLSLDSKIGKMGDEVLVSKSAAIKNDVEVLEKLDKYAEDLERKKLEKSNVKMSSHIDKNTDLKQTSDDINDLNVRLEEVDITAECNRKENVKHADPLDQNADKEFNSNTKEPESVKLKKSNKSSEKGSGKVKNIDKSKTDYLMQLLDKRKALLSKMVDIQENKDLKTDKQHTQVSETAKLDGRVQEKEIDTDYDIPGDSNIFRKSDKSDIERLKCDTADSVNTCTSKIVEEIPTEQTKSVEGLDSGPANIDESQAADKITKAQNAVKSRTTKGQIKKKAVSTVSLLCEGVRCWITQETAEYLVDTVDNSVESDVKLGKPEFDKQYKDLVASVDAQEKDFGALLGEESMDSDIKGQAVAPLPHFSVLKEEMEGDQKRVEEFMKGSFVYKISERKVDVKMDSNASSIVLPTVDRYDQLVIRQRITLERVSKVLPQLLPPLNLLVQDISTELRELIHTFNLTSDNIIYRPAEWTIVTIVLLRMLSKKLPSVRDSFCRPEAVRFYGTLLSGINTSLLHIDSLIHEMFVENTDGK